LVVLSRCFGWFGLFVRYFPFIEDNEGWLGGFQCALARDLCQRVRNM
jgi:hypothetical protein